MDNLSLVYMNQPVDLDTLLSSGVVAGGTWFDPSGSPLSSTLITAPSVVSAYDYTYEVSSPDCPTSAAEITLVVNGGCDYLERGIYKLRVYNSECQKTFKIVKQ
jgi:hypothetical protein